MLNFLAVWTNVYMTWIVGVVKYFNWLARFDNPESPTIREVVSGLRFSFGINEAITSICDAIWSFVFVMELSIWPDLVAKYVGH